MKGQVFLILCLFSMAVVAKRRRRKDCGISCATRMFKNLDAAGTPFSRFLHPWSIADLEKQCGTVKNGLRCFDSCPDSKPKKDLSPLLSNIRNVCYHELSDYLDHQACLRQKWRRIKWDCLSKCEPFDEKNTEVTLAVIGATTVSKESLFSLMDNYCKTFECHLFCHYPQFEEKCGQDPAVLAAQCDQTTLKSLKIMISQKQMLDFYPSSCYDLENCWIFRQIG